MKNKKIRNATTCKSGNITFKSQLEKIAYNYLLEQGFNPKYEPLQFTLWDGFTPITPFYDVESDKQYESRGGRGGKQLVLKNTKVIGVRYTPDLYFKYKDIDVWIEMKSIENDVFYIKKKLFRKYLDDVLLKTKQKSIYFEVHNKRQLIQAIEILKEYEQTI